jgi:hypothetical protein
MVRPISELCITDNLEAFHVETLDVPFERKSRCLVGIASILSPRPARGAGWSRRQCTVRWLSCKEIAAGADLRAAMGDALAAAVGDGWQPECDSAWCFFFARRGADRVEVGLQSLPPGAPTF